MYQTHFHLNDRPFASAPNPEHYFPASSIEQAREAIAISIERATGVTLLMGPVGSGKTLLCQLLANQFSRELPVCMLAGERLRDRTLLLQAILHRLDLPYRDQNEGELRLTLSNHVTGASCPRGILLIVDEADRLPLELLEEIRVITNLVDDGHPCVRLVLAGGPQLEERVGHPKLESLNQRVVGRLHLQNFSREETADYVNARIAACGGDVAGLFAEDAMEAIHRATSGVPRLVNQICDHALLMSSVEAIDQINATIVEEAWADLQQLPIPPRHYAETTQQDDNPDVVVEFGALDDEDPNASVCAQIDELHQVVSDINDDVDVGSVDITGNVEVEETVEIDGQFEFEPEVVLIGDFEPGEDEAAEESHADPSSEATSDMEFEPEVSEHEPSEIAEEAEPDILPTPFVQQPDDEVTSDAEATENESFTDELQQDLTLAEATNPFTEEFEEEEIVIQQFASPSLLARQGQLPVSSSYSLHLANRLAAAHPGLRIRAAGEGEVEDTKVDDNEYQPLSAYIGTSESTPTAPETFDIQPLQQEPTFDPAQDPVLPESEFAGSLPPIDQEPLLVDQLQPTQDIPIAASVGVDVVLDPALQLDFAASSQPTIVVDEPRVASEPPAEKKPRIFRTLFSKMRRA